MHRQEIQIPRTIVLHQKAAEVLTIIQHQTDLPQAIVHIVLQAGLLQVVHQVVHIARRAGLLQVVHQAVREVHQADHRQVVVQEVEDKKIKKL